MIDSGSIYDAFAAAAISNFKHPQTFSKKPKDTDLEIVNAIPKQKEEIKPQPEKKKTSIMGSLESIKAKIFSKKG